jgi:hypothetical protein
MSNPKQVIATGSVTKVLGEATDGTFSFYISRKDHSQNPILVKLSKPPLGPITIEDCKGNRIAVKGKLETDDRGCWTIFADSTMDISYLEKCQYFLDEYRSVFSDGKINEYVEL